MEMLPPSWRSIWWLSRFLAYLSLTAIFFSRESAILDMFDEVIENEFDRLALILDHRRTCVPGFYFFKQSKIPEKQKTFSSVV